ncbi:MAG: family 16 glycosylhydrolase [Bacteroidota bacterium]
MKYFLYFFLGFSFSMISACKGSGGEEPTPELPNMSISSVTLFEGNESKEFGFKVSISANFEKDVIVDYKTDEVTAGADEDFVAATGTVTIPAGERSVNIQIEILPDTLREPDEQFKVVLSNPVNANLQSAEGLGTIRNDDTFVFIPDEGYITPTNYTGFDLVWADEFEGTSINTDNWTHEIGGHGWGNEESQYYTDREDNSYVSNGNLIIEAKLESFSGSAYTSARMITLNKQSFQYGRVDIRAILPEGQGIWPALWMLGNNFPTVGWPACGEIDIMELLGHEPEKTHGTAHWGAQGQGFSHNKSGSLVLQEGKFSDEYHVFSIIWEPGSIKWLLDDEEFHTVTNADVNGAYPFDAEFFFIFNIAVGGRWPGYPDATTQFPQQMLVDYIRVFQEK